MINFDLARTLLLDHYNPMLARSQPFGDVPTPGRVSGDKE